MSTWVIGDIQGCFDSFSALLDRIAFRPKHDLLWLTGDLVNRGPRSLDVLRWVRAHDEQVRFVLGNHDLHLLACAAGVVSVRKRDTLAPILDLPRDEIRALVTWLRRKPLLIREGRTIMVHAGIWPGWGFSMAAARAAEVEKILRGERWRALLAAWRGSRRHRPVGWAARWRDDLAGEERAVTLLEIFTRMRCLDADGALEMDYAGPPRGRPPGSEPWYGARRGKKGTIFFGHWAAHGYARGEGWVALDSGCVWGGSLTAYRLKDGRVVSQPALE